MARTLFGTDGIRGVAGEYPLDPKTANAVGTALGRLVCRSKLEPRVVIGMDTRESGHWIASEVAGGLESQEVSVNFAGITTTPGVAYLAKNGPYAAGVMISASHNPYRDNGIKLIGHSGYKLPDQQEEILESEIFALLRDSAKSSPVTLHVDSGLDRTYIQHLASTLPQGLGGLRIVCDCANGSASALAPELFERLGAIVGTTHCSPDGRNINLNCGSLHLEVLRQAVLEESADVGVAFDGDADRALFVSRSGKIVDGDAVLLVTSRYLKDRGWLACGEGPPTVVATVMSNLGLERALASHGIRLIRTPVGDKYVLEEMIRIGAVLGGEQSGHVIFHQYATTGDGMLTALRVFEAMRAAGTGLDELTSELQVYPQRLVNVRVRERKPIEELPGVKAAIHDAEKSFGDAGRVLVRFSGTEPVARVMVEGPDLERVEKFANHIASEIRAELGAE
ncbi:MAG TPA: phosphoglucosamine mutase [Bryobacteraceae bacterium]|nr:phosphoglucosamine mutase [Bryobacteraceae bacterium]